MDIVTLPKPPHEENQLPTKGDYKTKIAWKQYEKLVNYIQTYCLIFINNIVEIEKLLKKTIIKYRI